MNGPFVGEPGVFLVQRRQAMQRRTYIQAAMAGVMGTLLCTTAIQASEPDEPKAAANESVKAKPIADQTKKALAYLVSQQQPDGGGGQGGGWRSANQGGRVEGENVQDSLDVGNTAIATLALIRAGHTAKAGEYAKNVARAVEFITGKIDK